MDISYNAVSAVKTYQYVGSRPILQQCLIWGQLLSSIQHRLHKSIPVVYVSASPKTLPNALRENPNPDFQNIKLIPIYDNPERASCISIILHPGA